jgi:transglutaminase-like putative cysteine protease/uncharacterized protein (DUF58 family)
MNRPVGISAGGIGLLLAWVGGATIAQLTGATPVVILLAAGVVLFGSALVAGLVTLRSVAIDSLRLPPSSTQGEPFVLSLAVRSPRPVWVEVRTGDHVVSSGWAFGDGFAEQAVMDRRGVIDQVDVSVRSAGAIGLMWWSKRLTVETASHLVAARAHPGDVSIERSSQTDDGDSFGPSGAIAGEIDGVRPWREGDSEKFVHWASTVRTGELVVHDRRGDRDLVWVVRAQPHAANPDAEAGAVRWALEQGLRAGARVGVAVGDAEIVAISDVESAARWSALAELGPMPLAPDPRRSPALPTEPESTASVSARWWAAAATLVSLWTLIGALDYGAMISVLAAAGTFAGAAVSARTLTTGEQPSLATRVVIAAGALVALAMVLAASGRLDGLLGVLRGPLPQVLIVLIVLHGFECHDRRTIRVGLGISAIVMMYASGFLVDGRVGLWLLGWSICFGVALSKLSHPTRRVQPAATAVMSRFGIGRWLPRAAGLSGGFAATVMILAVVPVPAGPANLTLPTIVRDASDVPRPGAIAGPDGDVRDTDPGPAGGGRAPAGQAGGYTGFAQEMDTSVRGELSDQVVMRVRAPEPDFWRGQTFASFDGRRWYADQEVGTRQDGPNIEVASALGDIRLADDVAVDQFVQTFYLEVDMPNLVFHANRPVQVIIDADVWTRQDGAIRASTVLPEGSIYTVVSARAEVDEALLRRQGLIGDRLTELGRQALSRYLELPASTTPETVALADELAAGRSSTYDVVRAYETWMSQNVEYDLKAPLPDPGEDAVHDFLFDSRLGFCEQIASSLTIMLRTQGVPARLVTGYLPGARDRIAGVFEVKSSDAHAWVEVWFPETGWQAFDPTAAVPLSANSEIDSVGADLAAGMGRFVRDHLTWMALILAFGLGGLVSAQLIRELGYRRDRGRWGLLQDRFGSVASRRGATVGSPNPRLAMAWTGTEDAEAARVVAERLDRAAFDPTFVDDAQLFAETRKLVGSLPGLPR